MPSDRTSLEITLVAERVDTDRLHFYIGASCFGLPQSSELPIHFTPYAFGCFSTL